ncbi:hypothetical protein CCR94_12275 [Rhodoblastus sphagnicola]|uniref:Uncharacterized protein n=1 Tax=Rhodoblastus sphagnicola TaxID=333368 RepID=A0A2S6N7E6_9HYPH|nr:hypothetical protein CCR94_12275 [Rhodoblastus sphagnicola]
MAVALRRFRGKKMRWQGARDTNVLLKERIMTAPPRSIDPFAPSADREAKAPVFFPSDARHTH